MKALALLAAALLAGCAAQESRLEPVEVRVPIPVRCRVQLPAEPAWAMDASAQDADIDALMAAALAELKQREGYEIELKAAAAACDREPNP